MDIPRSCATGRRSTLWRVLDSDVSTVVRPTTRDLLHGRYWAPRHSKL